MPTELPYDFDLHYDIKTYGQLLVILGARYRTKHSDSMATLIRLTKHHNIDLPIGVQKNIKEIVVKTIADYQALLTEL